MPRKKSWKRNIWMFVRAFGGAIAVIVAIWLCAMSPDDGTSQLGTMVWFDRCTFKNPNCFDFSRCPPDRNFSVAIYPSGPQSIRYSPWFAKMENAQWFLSILDAIARSRYYVSDPKDACVLVPSLDHSLVNSEMDVPTRVWMKLRSLKYWDGSGRNHLLFSKHDRPYLQYDPQQAMVAKVGFSWTHFRPGFDISLAPPTAWMAQDRVRPVIDGVELWKERDEFFEAHGTYPQLPYLMTFRGALTYPLRKQLLKLHNGHDIIVAHAVSVSSYGAGDSKGSYEDLLKNSQFALCPRGNGMYSYRMMEAMAAGAIPVILSDDFVLPFQDVVDWYSFAIIVPERRWKELPELLRSIPPGDLRQMRHEMFDVYRTYFSSIDLHVETVLEQLKHRIYGH